MVTKCTLEARVSSIGFGCKSCQRLPYAQARRQFQNCPFELNLSSANEVLGYDPCRESKRPLFPKRPGCRCRTAVRKCPAPGSRRVLADKKQSGRPAVAITRVA